MILAALGALNGNIAALDAALRDIDTEGIETICCTGDLAAGGPDPGAVVARVRERRILTVQGERDRLTVRWLRKKANLVQRLPADECAALETAFNALSSDALEFLRGLPRTVEFTLEGIGFAVCHGTLTSASPALEADTAEDIFRRQRELTAARVVISGRSATAFSRWVGDTLFVGAGAVHVAGAPGTYALIDTDQTPWGVEARPVRLP